MEVPSAVTAFLFTDIEGSTRLWEDEPERMRPALARHDVLVGANDVSGGNGLLLTRLLKYYNNSRSNTFTETL